MNKFIISFFAFFVFLVSGTTFLGAAPPDKVLEWIDSLNDPHEWYWNKVNAAAFLGESREGAIYSLRASQALIGSLYDNRLELSFTAAEALGKLQDTRATPHLIQKLSGMVANFESIFTIFDERPLRSRRKHIYGGTPIVDERRASLMMVWALGQMGDHSSKELLEAAANSDWRVRGAAAWAIGYLVEAEMVEIPTAADLLMKLLTSDSNDLVKIVAVKSLGRIKDIRATYLLIDVLKGASETMVFDDMKKNAIWALGNIVQYHSADTSLLSVLSEKPSSLSATEKGYVYDTVDTLFKLFGNELDPTIQESDEILDFAAETLAKIGKPAVEGVFRHFDFKDFASLGGNHKRIILILSQIKDARTFSAIFSMIFFVGRCYDPAFHDLVFKTLSQFDDIPDEVIYYGAQHYQSSRVTRDVFDHFLKTPLAVKRLIRLLNDDNPSAGIHSQIVAIEILGELGAAAEIALEPLIEKLRRERASVLNRQTEVDQIRSSIINIIHSLAQIGSALGPTGVQKIVPPLMLSLSDPDERVRTKAIAVILKCKIFSEAILERMIKIFSDPLEPFENRMHAVRATGSLVADLKQKNPSHHLVLRTVYALINLLEDEPFLKIAEIGSDYEKTAMRVIEILGEFKEPKSIRPMVQYLLKRKVYTNEFKESCKSALKSFGPAVLHEIIQIISEFRDVSRETFGATEIVLGLCLKEFPEEFLLLLDHPNSTVQLYLGELLRDRFGGRLIGVIESDPLPIIRVISDRNAALRAKKWAAFFLIRIYADNLWFRNESAIIPMAEALIDPDEAVGEVVLKEVNDFGISTNQPGIYKSFQRSIIRYLIQKYVYSQNEEEKKRARLVLMKIRWKTNITRGNLVLEELQNRLENATDRLSEALTPLIEELKKNE